MGEVICGRWELMAPIAIGGSSTVWRARDMRDDRVCALKVLRQRDGAQLLRFAREQAIRIDHPHVVAPSAWGADDGSIAIACELVSGGSLAGLVADYGALGEGTVVTILDQLLSALGAVHAAGIVHRDVTPANVLLRATGSGPLDVALVDFGIAAGPDDPRLTHAGFVVGTPGYVPPEVVQGLGLVRPDHDLYALGCLARVLLAGGEDAPAVAPADDALARTVASMTAPDRGDRPADVAAAAELLRGAVRDPHPLDRDGDPIEVFDHLSGEGAHDAEAGADADAPGEPDPTPAGAGTAAGTDAPGGTPLTGSGGSTGRRGISVWIAAVSAVAIALLVWGVLQLPAVPEESPPGPTPTVSADACTWVDEGDTRAGPTGAERCVRTADGYVWNPIEP